MTAGRAIGWGAVDPSIRRILLRPFSSWPPLFLKKQCFQRSLDDADSRRNCALFLKSTLIPCILEGKNDKGEKAALRKKNKQDRDLARQSLAGYQRSNTIAPATHFASRPLSPVLPPSGEKKRNRPRKTGSLVREEGAERGKVPPVRRKKKKRDRRKVRCEPEKKHLQVGNLKTNNRQFFKTLTREYTRHSLRRRPGARNGRSSPNSTAGVSTARYRRRR